MINWNQTISTDYSGAIPGIFIVYTVIPYIFVRLSEKSAWSNWTTGRNCTCIFWKVSKVYTTRVCS